WIRAVRRARPHDRLLDVAEERAPGREHPVHAARVRRRPLDRAGGLTPRRANDLPVHPGASVGKRPVVRRRRRALARLELARARRLRARLWRTRGLGLRPRRAPTLPLTHQTDRSSSSISFGVAGCGFAWLPPRCAADAASSGRSLSGTPSSRRRVMPPSAVSSSTRAAPSPPTASPNARTAAGA